MYLPNAAESFKIEARNPREHTVFTSDFRSSFWIEKLVFLGLTHFSYLDLSFNLYR